MRFRQIGQILNLTRGNARQSFGIESFHHPARRHRRLKDLKGRSAEHLGEISQLHPITSIRLVHPIRLHRFPKRHPRKGRWNLDPTHLFPDALNQPLNQSVNVFPTDKRHFDVDLGEFWLTICPQILIPKTAGNLKIFLGSTHHQQLLKLLWRLRQRIKLPWIQPRRHQILPRSLGGALKKNWRLNLPKSLLAQMVPDGQSGSVSRLQSLGHRGSAQIQIPIS